MHFCKYELFSWPKDASEYESIGLLLRTLPSFLFFCSGLFYFGSRVSSLRDFYKVLLKKTISCSFQYLRFKGITQLFSSVETPVS